ncbi:MAG: hypothetical protein AAFO91_18000 [Bacteroidota bacterium]
MGQHGTASVAISSDARYVAAVTADPVPRVLVWKWTVSAEPVAMVRLGGELFRDQANLRFHPEDSHLMVSNSEMQTVFYSWEGTQIKYDAPTLNDTTFNKPVGAMQSSIFQVCAALINLIRLVKLLCKKSSVFTIINYTF